MSLLVLARRGGAVTAPPAEPGTEPFYNAGADTLLLGGRDGSFDTYANTTALRSAWTTRGTSATLITPGASGSGNACRFTIPVGAGEVDYGLELYFGGATAASLVVQFDFRMSAGADFTSGRYDQSGTKWVLLFRDYNGGILPRCTLGVQSLQGGVLAGPADNGVQFEFRDQSVTPPGSILQNASKAIGWNTTNEQGTTNRATAINDGNWHRYTTLATPTTDTARIWVDGVLTNTSSGVTYPMDNNPFDGCAIAGPIVPDMLSGYAMTMDIDNLSVFGVG